ncbi:hypothetical protein HCA00_15635 [Listeria booriae]|uniref:T7SS effector LXG polymorphic toxin n=1 Tax=Listeria booriae TaxID=1552123 RepID=UPI00164E2209|nr:T7SS effector LXG polymorphic toxin [Listeria booriae]MBC6130245.1 hypothetical protein [Listeria booriae]
MPRIDIGEVSYFVSHFTRESERLRGALTDYRKAVAKLIADDAMQGEFITSAKSYYEHIHYPIVDTTIACLSEADTILKKYVADYAAQVDDATNSRLDSDRLEALYTEIRRSENALDDLTHAMESMAGGLNIGQQIGMKLGLETTMGQIKEEIKILERYLDFENSHINVMDDVLTRMYQVKTGVNEILAGKAFNGTTHMYDSSKMQLGWLDHLVPEKKPEKAYNFEEYTKTFVDGYWILSKNGVTDQEAAKATVAYNDALKDGTIKREVGDADIDFETEYMLAAMEGYNLLTGEPVTKMQSFSIISAVLLGGVAMKGRGMKLTKINLNRINSEIRLRKTDSISFSKGETISKNILATKPKNSPNPDKWLNKGGKISISKNGTWTYHHPDNHFVEYTDGFPNFKDSGFVKQEVSIGKFESYVADFTKADKLAPKGPRDAQMNTWHHHQDGETLQEVNKEIHKDYTHRGGMSLKKKQ